MADRIYQVLVAIVFVLIVGACGGTGGGGGVGDTGPAAPAVCPAYDPSLLPAAGDPAQVQRADGGGPMPGDFAVTDDGVATYTLPIWSPPGRAGVGPDLSIRYEHSAGDGALGVGFKLQGISRISRCPANLLQEGERRPLRFDDTDPLCLDGARLVPLADVPDEFRTVPDSFARIRRIRVDGVHRFVVERVDGAIDTYAWPEETGPGGAARAWLRSERRDRNGNFVRTTYTNRIASVGVESAVPVDVHYSPDFHVRFSYDVRPEPVIGFADGVAVAVEQRLTTISVAREPVGGAAVPLRTYRLSYVDDRGTSRRTKLRSVEECAGAGAADDPCRSPTSFEWATGGGGLDGAAPWATELFLVPRDVGLGDASDPGHPHPWPTFQVLDANHDGIPDVLEAHPVSVKPLAPQETKLRLGSKLGHEKKVLANLGLWSREPDPGEQPSAADPTQIMGTDADFDGRVDLLVSQGAFTFLPGAPLANGFSVIRVSDVGGLSFVSQNIPRPSVLAAPPFGGTQHKWLVDLDGDGAAELLTCEANPVPGPRWKLYRRASSGWLTMPEPIEPLEAASPPTVGCEVDLLPMDIDGDGDTDLLVKTGEVLRFATVNETDRSQTWSFPGIPAGEIAVVSRAKDWSFTVRSTGLPAGASLGDFGMLSRSMAYDANGDGLLDLAFPVDVTAGHAGQLVPRLMAARVHLALNQGGSFGASFPLPGHSEDSPGLVYTQLIRAVTADLDGDGAEELIAPSGISTMATGYADFAQARQSLFRISAVPTLSAAALPAVGKVLVPPTIANRFLSDDPDTPEDEQLQVPTAFTRASGVRVADLNGDGLADLVAYAPPGRDRNTNLVTFLGRAASHQSARPDRVIRIRDGLHQAGPASVTIDYGTLAGLDGSACDSARQICHRGTRDVVVRELHDDGRNAVRTFRHQYADGRIDRKTGEWLGFAKHVIVGPSLGEEEDRRTIRTFDNTTTVDDRFVFAHRLKSNCTAFRRDDGAADEFCESYDYSVRSRGETYFVYRSGATKRDTEAGVVVQEVHVESQVDDHGSTFLTRTTHLTGEITEVARNVSHDEERWLLGLVHAERVSHSAVTGAAVAPRESWFTYDSRGQLESVTVEPKDESQVVGQPAVYSKTTLTRDAHGNVVRVLRQAALARDRETCVAYDPDGYRPFSMHDGVLAPRLARFGAAGQLLAASDPDGLVTTQSWDGLLRPVATVAPDGSGLVRRVSQVGEHVIVREKAAGGGARTVEFDRLGRPISTTQVGLYGRIETVSALGYDRLGRVVSAAHPAGASSTLQVDSFEHDHRDRLTRSVHADGSSERWTYGAATVRHTDRTFSDTTSFYDPRGRLVRVRDARGGEKTFAWRPDGLLESMTDPLGQVTRVEYDVLGRTTKVDDPNQGVRHARYDGFGQTIATRDAEGAEVGLAYDSLGRLTARAAPEGTSTFEYDGPGAAGLLWRATSPDGIVRQQAYTDKKQPRSDTVTLPGGESYRTSYLYDDVGRLSGLVYPGGELRAVYAYDSVDSGRLTSLSLEHAAGSGASAVAGPVWQKLFDAPWGSTMFEKLGNGTFGAYAFDPRNENLVSTVTYAPGFDAGNVVELQRDDLLHNAAGDVVRRIDRVSGQQERYHYDSLHRLIGSDLGSGKLGVTSQQQYDAVGNVTHKADVGEVRYDDAAHPSRMTRAGGETFEYDANGNVTETSSEKLPTAAVRVAYTSFHKPSRITAGGTAWKVGYDAFQQRVVKSTTERRVVTVGEHFQEERSPGGRQQRFYLTNGERVVAVATREDGDGEPKWGLTYQHHDHLGSPVATTTRTGEVSARHSFSPFGERRDPSDWRSRPPPGPPAGDVGRGFTFHEEDVVGWLNTKGRLYSPRHGRFLQADPTLPEVHLTQGGHRYSYVGNNPVNAVDPFGYQAAGNRDAEGADFPEGSKNQPIETVWVFGVRPGAAEPARAAGDGGTESGRAADVAAANGPGGGTGAIGSTFGDEALARFDSNADAVVALGTVFAEHPVTSTAIAVPAIGFSPLWAGPAVAVGLVVTGTDAADAYRRGGLGGLSGFAAGEVGFQVGFGKAVGLAGEGVAVASRGIARAAGVALRYGEAMLPALRATGTRAADVLQKAALAPMWFAVGAGGGLTISRSGHQRGQKPRRHQRHAEARER